ncbi:MAG TPA: carboxypeptidase regulatory-like domain-containing protein [Vicinamibacterales bacterium]
MVRDSTGLVLPGATVELGSAGDPIAARSTASAADGTFAFPDVPVGRYRLRVTFPAFASVEQVLTVDGSLARPLMVILAVSGMQEQVSVVAPSIDLPATATMQTDVTRHLIDTLPSESVSGGLSSLVTLTTPGVAADSNGGFHPLGDHADTSFSVDNQPITDQQSRTFSNQLSQSAIQSLDVLTGVPPAEFGDKTSLIVKATTRSGLGEHRPTGSLSLGYGSFATPTASFTLGAGSPRIGNFLALDGLASGRFLDAPEIQPFHAQGNVVNLFDRFDARLSTTTTVQLNVSAARSVFQAPNTFDQQAAGQDQQQHQHSFNAAPSLMRTLNGRAVVEVNAWARRDIVEYDPSPNLLNDQPAFLSQHRTLSNAGAKAVLSGAVGAHTLKAGLQETTTWLGEQFRTGLTDPTFNTPCFTPAGDPSADTSLRVPQQCAGHGLVANEAFLPGLLPYDLTRGGTLFSFAGDGTIIQWAAYLQDSLKVGHWDVTAGLRLDVYDGLSRATGLQPRLGAVYRIDRTDTVLRASYGRILLTPYNENLVLASSTGSGGLGGGLLGSVGGAPLTPGRRDQYDVGIQQTTWRGLRIDGEYFWKFTDGAYDFGIILNTPLAFPVQFRQSTQDGGLVRIALPESHGWQMYTTLSHTRSRLFGPELGGLRFSADYAPVARPDHDEPFQSNTHLEYRSTRALGFWSGLTWRYDSGLVAVAVPTYEAALRLTGDEQAVMGLYCGSTVATRDQPIRSCAAPTFGASRINIPAPGTENDDTNPPRIVPHQLVDVAVGLDGLKVGPVPLRIRVTVINLFDTNALYNFLSTFSGTHFVTPRALQVQLSVPF